jgi:hypothetical protein
MRELQQTIGGATEVGDGFLHFGSKGCTLAVARSALQECHGLADAEAVAGDCSAEVAELAVVPLWSPGFMQQSRLGPD